MKISGHSLLARSLSVRSSQHHPGARTLWESGSWEKNGQGVVISLSPFWRGQAGVYVFHKHRELSEELQVSFSRA